MTVPGREILVVVRVGLLLGITGVPHPNHSTTKKKKKNKQQQQTMLKSIKIEKRAS